MHSRLLGIFLVALVYGTSTVSASCPADYCANGGLCEDDRPWHPRCSCLYVFVGDRCEEWIGEPAGLAGRIVITAVSQASFLVVIVVDVFYLWQRPMKLDLVNLYLAALLLASLVLFFFDWILYGWIEVSPYLMLTKVAVTESLVLLADWQFLFFFLYLTITCASGNLASMSRSSDLKKIMRSFLLPLGITLAVSIVFCFAIQMWGWAQGMNGGLGPFVSWIANIVAAAAILVYVSVRMWDLLAGIDPELSRPIRRRYFTAALWEALYILVLLGDTVIYLAQARGWLYVGLYSAFRVVFCLCHCMAMFVIVRSAEGKSYSVGKMFRPAFITRRVMSARSSSTSSAMSARTSNTSREIA